MSHKMFTKAALECAHAFTSKEGGRYGTYAVHVSERGLGATDGRRAVTITWPSTSVDQFPACGQPGSNGRALPSDGVLIPRDQVQALAKAIPKAGCMPILAHALVDVENTDRETVIAYTTDLETKQRHEMRTLDASFPDIAEATPQTDPCASVTINPTMLAEMLKALAKLVDNNEVTLELRSHGQAVVLRAHGRDGQEAKALLMPIGDP